jgi:ADP-heptose:LPS heptosyltransferase
MHWLEVTTPIEFKSGGRRLETGVPYAMDDHAAAAMLGSGTLVNTPEGKRALGQIIRLNHAPELHAPRPVNEDGLKVLVHRSGGIGDLLLMTPALRAYKRRFPKARIFVCTTPKMRPVLEGNPDVEGFVEWPPKESEVYEHDTWCFYENIIENNPLAQDVHAVDLYAMKLLGDSRIEDWTPVLNLTEAEKAEASAFFESLVGGAARAESEPAHRSLLTAHSLPSIAIQVKASSPVRTWPAGPMSDLIQMLLDHAHVFLFGAPGEVEYMGEHPRLTNLSASGRTFRQSCAILVGCQALVAPDSALLHVAAALKVPTVALFGPFPSKLRITSACQHAIDGGGLCAPCFHHSRGSEIFPEGSPCSREKRCHVLGAIAPARVFAEVMRLAKEPIPNPLTSPCSPLPVP